MNILGKGSKATHAVFVTVLDPENSISLPHSTHHIIMRALDAFFKLSKPLCSIIASENTSCHCSF